jgi:putative PIN family toxin of toxin-antitoxin system
LRAVLDANVLISALIRPAGPPGRIVVRLLRDRAFELVASPATLDELRRSLRYPKVRKYLDLSVAEIDLWVVALRAVAVIVEGRVSPPRMAWPITSSAATATSWTSRCTREYESSRRATF